MATLTRLVGTLQLALIFPAANGEMVKCEMSP
jgi:hypothetical protein